MDNLTIILVGVGILLAIILTIVAFTIWKFFRQRFHQDNDVDDKNFRGALANRKSDDFRVPSLPVSTRRCRTQMPYQNEMCGNGSYPRSRNHPKRRSQEYYDLLKNKTSAGLTDDGYSDELTHFLPAKLIEPTSSSKFVQIQKRVSDGAIEHLKRQGRKQSTIDLRASMTEEMFQESLQGTDSQSRGSLITLDESEVDDNNSSIEFVDSTDFGAKKRRIGESRARNGSTNVDGPPSRPKKTYKKAGKINFSTEYKKEENAFEVYILRAYDLAPKRDVDEINPYVRVSLIPGRKQKQATRWQKATKEPFINEKFIFTELTNEDIKKYRLKLKVYNKNKITREVLGEVDIALSAIELEKKENFNVDLYKKRSESSLASVHISLCHQATYSKLEVVLNEAKHLPKAGLGGNPDPYITVMLFRETTTTRKNTATKRNARDPTFHETLEFEIATDSTKPLSTYTLVVTVNDAGIFKRKEVLGHVIFSLTSPQPTAAQHWKSVQEKPHEYHSHWHSLVDPDEL